MGSSTFNSTYFQPTNIRHKYVCPGSSRYSRRHRQRVIDKEKEKEGNVITKSNTRERKCPPLKARSNISLFHLLFGILIFLAIVPAVGCLPSPSFVEPELGWFATALTSVVAAVTGASIAMQPSAAEPSNNVASTDNSMPSLAPPSFELTMPCLVQCLLSREQSWAKAERGGS